MCNPNYKFIEDMRSREVNMEKENNKKVNFMLKSKYTGEREV